MTIEITGTLAEDARFGIGRVNDAVITLRVVTGPSIFEARVVAGNTPADHIAAQLRADRWRRGDPVHVRCSELAWCSDHDVGRFVARGLQAVSVRGASAL